MGVICLVILCVHACMHASVYAYMNALYARLWLTAALFEYSKYIKYTQYMYEYIYPFINGNVVVSLHRYFLFPQVSYNMCL